jgi:hydrogenase-4 membrane subunit HyfE
MKCIFFLAKMNFYEEKFIIKNLVFIIIVRALRLNFILVKAITRDSWNIVVIT